ncbi:MAG: S-adenosylmethionine decarboxylase family protein [Gammaproteobacteria bacterium]
MLRRAVANAGLQEVAHLHHEFEPEGMTAVLVLAQSHAVLHTWPEHNVMSIDLYACTESTRLTDFLEAMTTELGEAPLETEVRSVVLPVVATPTDE